MSSLHVGVHRQPKPVLFGAAGLINKVFTGSAETPRPGHVFTLSTPMTSAPLRWTVGPKFGFTAGPTTALREQVTAPSTATPACWMDAT
eukprot:408554-Rhodomonas_salina.1